VPCYAIATGQIIIIAFANTEYRTGQPGIYCDVVVVLIISTGTKKYA